MLLSIGWSHIAGKRHQMGATSEYIERNNPEKRAALVFIWGNGKKSKNENSARVLYPCPCCAELRSFAVFETYHYGHVYGIRIAKWKTSRFVICYVCQYQIAIPTQQGFNNAKLLDQVLNALIQTNPTEAQLWRFVARVADEVLHHPEAVQYAIEVAANLERHGLRE